MRVLLFEDKSVDLLAPITTGRAAFQILCGCYRLLELARKWSDQPVAAWVRSHLREMVFAEGCELVDWQNTTPGEGLLLAVNAALVPSLESDRLIRQVIARGRPTLVLEGTRVVACLMPPRAALAFTPDDASSVQDHVDETLAAKELAGVSDAPLLLRRPHEVIAAHMRSLGRDLPEYAAASGLPQREDGVYAAKDVVIGPHTVIDPAEGPVVLQPGVRIGPFAYLRGPLLVGANSRINEYAALKDGVTLGQTTKIGGEVEASVVDSFSNKQHHGFLGHSYLGSWINLGAGTCNSDLKNTYGKINVEYGEEKTHTGMQFLGCVIGDYSKTAINTGIFTGKIIGVCSMLYGYVTTNVPSFVNYARLFGQVAELPPEVMIATQARMFSRRGVPQRDCDVELIRSMYAVTAVEREFGLTQLANL